MANERSLARSSEEKDEWDSFYRQHAPDRLPWETGNPEQDLVELIEGGKIGKGRVLDICSGLGTQSIYLAKRGFEVYGIDISPTAVEMALERCREEGVACRFSQGNAADLGYSDGFFTFVFDRGCFHSVPPKQREAFIRGVHRVLKKGGRYYLKCFSEKNGEAWNHFSEEEIRRYFSDRFRILELKEDIYVEHTSSQRVHFYSVLMEAKG